MDNLPKKRRGGNLDRRSNSLLLINAVLFRLLYTDSMRPNMLMAFELLNQFDTKAALEDTVFYDAIREDSAEARGHSNAEIIEVVADLSEMRNLSQVNHGFRTVSETDVEQARKMASIHSFLIIFFNSSRSWSLLESSRVFYARTKAKIQTNGIPGVRCGWGWLLDCKQSPEATAAAAAHRSCLPYPAG